MAVLILLPYKPPLRPASFLKEEGRRRENDRRVIRREKRKKRFAGMNKPVKPGNKKKKIAIILLTLIILILGLGYLYLAKLASNLDFVFYK